MRRMSIKPGAGSRALAVVCLLAGLVVTSCQKEKIGNVKSATPSKNKYQIVSGTFDASGANTAITAFYQKVKTLRSGTSAESISADDALFLIEGTYNKYVAERQFNCDVVPYEFSVRVPVQSDGALNMKDVSNAFYTIRDLLLARKNELGGSQVAVESFDLDIAERPTGLNDQLVLHGITIFKRPNPGFPIDMTQWCNDNFHEEPTHVWSSLTESTYVMGWSQTGQAKIDHTTKHLVPGSENSSLPGAASSLRAKGVGNYQQFYCKSMVCGYFVNVSHTQDFYMGNPGSLPNEYVNLGIPDYDNVGTWTTDKVYKNQWQDPYDTYKHWLTTGMMNYYLVGIPAIIQAQVVPGKTFANFHVWTNSSLTPPSIPWYSAGHWYRIYSGDFVPTPGADCTGKTELGYL